MTTHETLRFAHPVASLETPRRLFVATAARQEQQLHPGATALSGDRLDPLRGRGRLALATDWPRPRSRQSQYSSRAPRRPLPGPRTLFRPRAPVPAAWGRQPTSAHPPRLRPPTSRGRPRRPRTTRLPYATATPSAAPTPEAPRLVPVTCGRALSSRLVPDASGRFTCSDTLGVAPFEHDIEALFTPGATGSGFTCSRPSDATSETVTPPASRSTLAELATTRHDDRNRSETTTPSPPDTGPSPEAGSRQSRLQHPPPPRRCRLPNPHSLRRP